MDGLKKVKKYKRVFMSPENTKKLFNAFPNLYAGQELPITQSLMRFGFECNSGWFQLIWDLSEKLEELIIQYKKEYPNEPYYPQAIQVKEKYGTLRFYMTSATTEMWDLIEEAEGKSEEICEICGEPGNLTTSYGWMSVLCDKCKEKKNA